MTARIIFVPLEGPPAFRIYLDADLLARIPRTTMPAIYELKWVEQVTQAKGYIVVVLKQKNLQLNGVVRTVAQIKSLLRHDYGMNLKFDDERIPKLPPRRPGSRMLRNILEPRPGRLGSL